MNKIIVSGNLTKDYIAGETRFGIAIDNYRKESKTLFITVFFNKGYLSEAQLNLLKKGSKLLIEGSIGGNSIPGKNDKYISLKSFEVMRFPKVQEQVQEELISTTDKEVEKVIETDKKEQAINLEEVNF